MKRKRDDEETVDRLSELPNSLISEILSWLETRDVVTISHLSKRWRIWKDEWTTIPYLYFNDDFGKNSYPFQKIINGVLQRWKGTKIIRFKISLRRVNNRPSSIDIARWVGFATEKKVDEIELDFPFHYWSLDELPQCLYSCSSITKLRLSGLSSQTERVVNVNVQWDRLENLDINCGGLNQELLHHLVSSAPQLQILDVGHVKCYRSLSIRSSTLKSMKINAYFVGDGPSTTFTLWAPNLEQLTLWMNGTTKHDLLFDVPALTYVALKKSHGYAGFKFEEATLKQLFLAIQHVKALTLRLPDYKKVFGVFMKGECLFSNVKILELIDCPMDSYDVVRLDEFFPKVEKLITDDHWLCMRDHLLDSEAKTLMPQLRTVEVTWRYSNNTTLIMKFIKNVLKFAIMVQKIVIKKVAKCCVLESERLELLMSLQSSFPTLDIIFC